MSVSTDKVCIGMITKPHGIKGQVCVRSYCANPTDLFQYAPITDLTGSMTFDLKSVGTVKGLFIASLKGYASRNDVEPLSQTELFVTRDQLPKLSETGEFYVSDLEGMHVVSEAGDVFGSIASVNNFGAGDVLEVSSDERKNFMLPFSEDAVLSIDEAQQKVVISDVAIAFIKDQGKKQ